MPGLAELNTCASSPLPIPTAGVAIDGGTLSITNMQDWTALAKDLACSKHSTEIHWVNEWMHVTRQGRFGIYHIYCCPSYSKVLLKLEYHLCQYDWKGINNRTLYTVSVTLWKWAPFMLLAVVPSALPIRRKPLLMVCLPSCMPSCFQLQYFPAWKCFRIMYIFHLPWFLFIPSLFIFPPFF